VKFNDSFIPTLATSPRVTAIVANAAETAADNARSNAPVDSGEYRDTIRVEITRTPYRVVAKVIADCDHGMIVESKHGTLARALNSVAGRG
jgi:hypothetical protein